MAFKAYIATAALLLALGAAACSHSAPAVAQGDTSVARGEQLVALGTCDECHTPRLPNGQLDMTRRLSGVPAGQPPPPVPSTPGDIIDRNGAFRGPWGLSLARNITPDPEHGIGNWTEAQFIKTLRTGVDPSGHALQPPMPWQAYANVADADLMAIYNFLRTVKPNPNPVTGP